MCDSAAGDTGNAAACGNIAREVGLFQKQACFYFQAIAARSVIERNVFFNGRVVE